MVKVAEEEEEEATSVEEVPIVLKSTPTPSDSSATASAKPKGEQQAATAAAATETTIKITSNSPNNNNNHPSTTTLSRRRRRSKRLAVPRPDSGKLRRSARKRARVTADAKLYGSDFGILPSDCSTVIASAIPGRVPLGFVCGYPLSHRRTGGEQYGGSLFARSAASDTLQGQAIQRVNQTWGEDPLGRATGRETIGITVCKKKYKPFLFPIVPVKQGGRRGSVSGGGGGSGDGVLEEGPVEVQVIRMFGCRCHHPLRKAVIERHGLRQGWEPFGQWSLRKAQDMARRETIRLNSQFEEAAAAGSGGGEPTTAAARNNKNKTGSMNKRNNKSGRVCKVAKLPAAKQEDDDDDDDSSTSSSSASGTDDAAHHHSHYHLQARLCLNGSCTWKLKSAYDDIFKEIHGYTESEAEDNHNA